MFFQGYGPFGGGGTFEQNYHVYPVSFIDKPHLENGDKVIMPPSALDRLASLRIDYPMLFEVQNPAANRSSHCGVLEFVADEGLIYMPYWMMQNLLLQEGDLVRLKSATLPKGTYVKLQPHTKDFLDISNPKAVLETTLRNFSCLTVGDNIMVAYNNKKYYIDIVEAKPSAAITIIETDCEVDFAPPLDYKEPERPPPPASTTTAAPAGPSNKQAADEPAPEPEKPQFQAFVGKGRRLDGKPGRPLESPDQTVSSSTGANGRSPVVAAPVPAAPAAATSIPASGSTGSKSKAGKLVFGGNAAPVNGNAAPQDSIRGSSLKPKDPVKEKEKGKEVEPQKDEPKFQAFSGKKYSLKD